MNLQEHFNSSGILSGRNDDNGLVEKRDYCPGKH